MIPSLSQESISQYASDAQTIQEPEGTDFTQGVHVGKTIPAKWWNWLFSAVTKRITQAKSDSQAMLTELTNAVVDAGLTPDATDNTQLAQAIGDKAKTQIDTYIENKKMAYGVWDVDVIYLDNDEVLTSYYSSSNLPISELSLVNGVYFANIRYYAGSTVNKYAYSTDMVHWHSLDLGSIQPSDRQLIVKFIQGTWFIVLARASYSSVKIYSGVSLTNLTAHSLPDVPYAERGDGIITTINDIFYLVMYNKETDVSIDPTVHINMFTFSETTGWTNVYTSTSFTTAHRYVGDTFLYRESVQVSSGVFVAGGAIVNISNHTAKVMDEFYLYNTIVWRKRGNILYALNANVKNTMIINGVTYTIRSPSYAVVDSNGNYTCTSGLGGALLLYTIYAPDYFILTENDTNGSFGYDETNPVYAKSFTTDFTDVEQFPTVWPNAQGTNTSQGDVLGCVKLNGEYYVHVYFHSSTPYYTNLYKASQLSSNYSDYELIYDGSAHPYDSAINKAPILVDYEGQALYIPKIGLGRFSDDGGITWKSSYAYNPDGTVKWQIAAALGINVRDRLYGTTYAYGGLSNGFSVSISDFDGLVLIPNTAMFKYNSINYVRGNTLYLR